MNNIVWVSGKEIANSLGYKNTRNAIATHVSPENRSHFGELIDRPVKGIPKQQLFLNIKGVEELLAKKKNHLASQNWRNFFESSPFLLPSWSPGAEEITREQFPDAWTEAEGEVKTTPFKSLAEIPETVSKPLAAHGYIYVLKLSTSDKTLGKVGKTRYLQTRKNAFQSQFKENVELVWFCFSFNMDVVEREILYKLNHMNALVNYQSLTEVFDPKVISFDELFAEIQRLVEVTNTQWEASEKKYEVQLEYLKFANRVVESTKQLANENPEKFQSFVDMVDKMLTRFEKI